MWYLFNKDHKDGPNKDWINIDKNFVLPKDINFGRPGPWRENNI